MSAGNHTTNGTGSAAGSHDKGVEVLWYMTGPDGRYPWREDGTRQIDHSYMAQIAGAVDRLGYTGALFATGAHDSWVLASSLIERTERMRFLVAVHPALISPVLAAKMAVTFDQFSGGRVMLNIVSGDDITLRRHGASIGHDERYAHCNEWLDIYRAAITEGSVEYDGKFFQVEGGNLELPPVQKPHPPIWFAGASEPAIEVAGKHVDTYLSWGEPPAPTAERIKRVKETAAKYGRENDIRFGIRLYVIVRDTDEEAWAEVDRLYSRMDDISVGAMQAMFRKTDSVGQQRMAALHNGQKPENPRDLEIHPNLWAGLGLVRPGPGTAIVGSPETVLETINEYREAGIETFIVSGIPLLEETYRVAEALFPHLPVAGRPDNLAGFGASASPHTDERSDGIHTWVETWAASEKRELAGNS